MRPIDGDRLMMHLTDWWYSSFGQAETDESKAIKSVLDKIEQSLGVFALEKQEADRWHSVAKEGNPKKSGLYIVTDNSKMDGDKPHPRYFNAYGDKAFWSGWRADEVIAWKEITSEPYTEEEE